MIFINPWAFYDPKDLPSPPNFHRSEGGGGLISIFCAFIAATIIYVSALSYLYNTEGEWHPFLVGITNGAYPIMIIGLIILFDTIEEKIDNRKKRKHLK